MKLGKIKELFENLEWSGQSWIENDGIGLYECHGYQGYDHGHDYEIGELEATIDLAKAGIGLADLTDLINNNPHDFELEIDDRFTEVFGWNTNLSIPKIEDVYICYKNNIVTLYWEVGT